MYNFNAVNNTTGETTTYTWDCNNRLLGLNFSGGEEMGFVYDSAGMLIREEASGVERRIIQRGVYGIREQVRSGQDTWENSVYHIPVSEHTSHEGRDGQILASYIRPGKNRPDGGAIFYHPDHLGSVRLITDEAGRIIDRTETDAYGSPLPHTTGNATPGSQSNKAAKMLQPLNYTGTLGIRYVEKIRMHNMRARWHHPQTARFTSMDKLFATNRYNYVAGNPVMMVDPMGEHEIRYGTTEVIQTVAHLHIKDRPAFQYMPTKDGYVFSNNYKEVWQKITNPHLTEPYKLTEDDLQILASESKDTMNSFNKRNITNENNWSENGEQKLVIEGRSEYNMNCAGLAFSGRKAIYINNSISDPAGLLKYAYTPVNTNLIEDLKPGDVIIENPLPDNFPSSSFTHVRTVVATAKSGVCFRALIYEVDGYNPITVTYLTRSSSLDKTLIFRPALRINYKSDKQEDPFYPSIYAFPWETFTISKKSFVGFLELFLQNEISKNWWTPPYNWTFEP